MLTDEDLSILNRKPVPYLAAVALQAGAEHFQSFDHARGLVLGFGSTKTISHLDALDLCASMRTWAYANPRPTASEIA